MITDFYNETFIVQTRTENKVNGKLNRSYSNSGPYNCAGFTPTIVRVVRWDKQDFVISKTLYCATTVPINLGDRATYNSQEYDVIQIENTNNQGHHYKIGLTSR